MSAKAKQVNWESVEADYRAGMKTLRQIGSDHGVSHVRIQQKAKELGWVRSLTERINAKAEEKLTKAALTKSLTKPVSDEAIVDANANLQVNVQLGHRSDIAALKKTIVGLSQELGALSDGALQDALHEILEEKVAEVESETRKTALYKAYGAAMALGGRAGAGQKLATALGTLIDKERQAFGIDKGSTEDKLATFLKSLPPPPTRVAA